MAALTAQLTALREGAGPQVRLIVDLNFNYKPEGFRRLGLGKIIGTRTWGGEIWLSAQRWLVDNGMASAAEFGVYGPQGDWLIEGHGVDPDIVVDNLPHATFVGQDAQLEAAVKHLQDLIAQDPRPVPPAPKYPDKSFKR